MAFGINPFGWPFWGQFFSSQSTTTTTSTSSTSTSSTSSSTSTTTTLPPDIRIMAHIKQPKLR